MDEHDIVRQTIFLCNQRLYLLCKLKKQGLPSNCLDLVFDSLIMSQHKYVSQSWSGYLNAELCLYDSEIII